MAFKAKKTTVDLELDLINVLGEENGNIKPKVEPNAENVIKWSEMDSKKERDENEKQYAIEVSILRKRIANGEIQQSDFMDRHAEIISSYDIKQPDPKEVTEFMIEKIDYWYKKGSDFWRTKVDFPLLNEIMGYINGQVLSIKKK